MGKASRLKQERRALRQDVKQELITRVESRATSRLPWGHPRRGPKVSEGLTALIEPYLYDDLDIDARRKLVWLAVLAWNHAVSPETLSQEKILSTLEDAQANDADLLLRTIEEMAQRKLREFADDRRLILDAELREESDGSFYLAAAAAQK